MSSEKVRASGGDKYLRLPGALGGEFYDPIKNRRLDEAHGAPAGGGGGSGGSGAGLLDQMCWPCAAWFALAVLTWRMTVWGHTYTIRPETLSGGMNRLLAHYYQVVLGFFESVSLLSITGLDAFGAWAAAESGKAILKPATIGISVAIFAALGYVLLQAVDRKAPRFLRRSLIVVLVVLYGPLIIFPIEWVVAWFAQAN